MGDAPTVALVTGASGGIGLALVDALLQDPGTRTVYACCRNPARAVALIERADLHERLEALTLDVTDPDTMRTVVERIEQGPGRLDLVINTAGLLHDAAGMRPEKRLSDINTEHLLKAYDVNALGAIRLARALEGLLKQSAAARFVSLSARVGSIGDNRLGGWYAYRASKAALNMLIKTLAIEWSRMRPVITCATLHPGTVATALSDPFTAGKDRAALFTPEQAATHLMTVINQLQPDDSGGFFAWDGTPIPW